MFSLIKNNYNTRKALNHFPSFFDDAFTKGFIERSDKFFTTPAVNIKETEKSFDIELAAPGMEKKDFKIDLKNGVLTVSAKHETKTEENDEKNNYTRREFSYQSFSRSFTLPEDKVNTEEINAKYENGILQVYIPKKEKDQTNDTKEIVVS